MTGKVGLAEGRPSTITVAANFSALNKGFQTIQQVAWRDTDTGRTQTPKELIVADPSGVHLQQAAYGGVEHNIDRDLKSFWAPYGGGAIRAIRLQRNWRISS